MGLDMYLSRKTYVQRWEHQSPDEKYLVTVERGGKPTDIDPERVTYIIEQMGYWRKANAIHRWFVENTQGGVDECRESYVADEQLAELLDLCRRVSANHALAEELLPTQSGFFFGSTEYDEYYFQDIERTIGILDGLPDGDYYYQSSW